MIHSYQNKLYTFLSFFFFSYHPWREYLYGTLVTLYRFISQHSYHLFLSFFSIPTLRTPRVPLHWVQLLWFVLPDCYSMQRLLDVSGSLIRHDLGGRFSVWENKKEQMTSLIALWNWMLYLSSSLLFFFKLKALHTVSINLTISVPCLLLHHLAPSLF